MDRKTEVTTKQSTPNFPQNRAFLTPWYAKVLLHTRTYAYQEVRNVRFSGTFGMLCFVVTTVLRFALLSYYASTQLSKSIPNNGSCIHFWITAKRINSNYGPKFLCCVGVRNAEIKHKHYYQFTAFYSDKLLNSLCKRSFRKNKPKLKNNWITQK